MYPLTHALGTCVWYTDTQVLRDCPMMWRYGSTGHLYFSGQHLSDFCDVMNHVQRANILAGLLNNFEGFEIRTNRCPKRRRRLPVVFFHKEISIKLGQYEKRSHRYRIIRLYLIFQRTRSSLWWPKWPYRFQWPRWCWWWWRRWRRWWRWNVPGRWRRWCRPGFPSSARPAAPGCPSIHLPAKTGMWIPKIKMIWPVHQNTFR